MKQLAILFLTLCLSTNLISQKTFSSTDPNYIKYVEAGEAALNDKKYEDCLDQYASAFKIKQTTNQC